MGITPQLNWECEKDSRFLLVCSLGMTTSFVSLRQKSKIPTSRAKRAARNGAPIAISNSFTGGNFGDVTGVPATWGPFSG